MGRLTPLIRAKSVSHGVPRPRTDGLPGRARCRCVGSIMVIFQGVEHDNALETNNPAERITRSFPGSKCFARAKAGGRRPETQRRRLDTGNNFRRGGRASEKRWSESANLRLGPVRTREAGELFREPLDAARAGQPPRRERRIAVACSLRGTTFVPGALGRRRPFAPQARPDACPWRWGDLSEVPPIASRSGALPAPVARTLQPPSRSRRSDRGAGEVTPVGARTALRGAESRRAAGPVGSISGEKGGPSRFP